MVEILKTILEFNVKDGRFLSRTIGTTPLLKKLQVSEEPISECLGCVFKSEV